MFDNLRDDSHGYKEEGQAKFQPASGTASGPIAPRSSRFLGMTSIQRLVIAVLLLAAVCVLGAMCLLVTGKIGF
jgi:hypothetical protein